MPARATQEEKEFKKQLGKRIQTLRIQKGLSQEQLGKDLRLSNSAVSNWETGLSAPPIFTLLALATLFNIHPHDLLPELSISDKTYIKRLDDYNDLKNKVGFIRKLLG